MTTTEQIGKLANVSAERASEIHEVLLSEALIDFSQATNREFKMAITLAEFFIQNGKRWE